MSHLPLLHPSQLCGALFLYLRTINIRIVSTDLFLHRHSNITYSIIQTHNHSVTISLLRIIPAEMKTYHDLCDEVQETKFGEYNQHHPSHGGKIRRVSHAKSLRRNQFCQLFNKASKPGKNYAPS